MLDDELLRLGRCAGELLQVRGETVAVAEGSCGGLVSAALLATAGASAWFRGGSVIYTGAAVRAFIAPTGVAAPEPMRGASEPFVQYLADSVRVALRSTWGIGEGGATGPSANPYGDPPGHCWIAVHGPTNATRHVLTGDADRVANMHAFTVATLQLLVDSLDQE